MCYGGFILTVEGSVMDGWMGSMVADGLLESSAVRALVCSNMLPLLCKTFCRKNISVSQP
jgi:hypothetical protein